MLSRTTSRRLYATCLGLAGLLVGCSNDAASWVPAGTLFEPRSGHSATLLSNGAVLFAGGTRDERFLATTEWRDSATNLWSLAPSMNIVRSEHAAATLDDGRLLVLGGTNQAGAALSSTEIFDASTQTWSVGTNMPTKRAQHTATNTSDGILVVGGVNAAGEPLATASIYDPAAETWTDAEPMKIARRGHSATQLRDGSILVIGGSNAAGEVLASVEILQGGAGGWQWHEVASLHHARQGHSATLLNDCSVLVVGGEDANGLIDSVERYGIACEGPYDVGDVIDLQPLSSPRTQHTATWLTDGSVLVAGGKASTTLVTAERFIPQDAHIPCKETVDCPQAMICDAELHCVQVSSSLDSTSGCMFTAERAPMDLRATGIGFVMLLGMVGMRRRRGKRIAPSVVAAGFFLVPSLSEAQTSTFYLDRMSIAGGSEDGVALWRPVFGRTGLFGQFALGYAYDALRVSSFVHDADRAQGLSGAAVRLQVTGYATAGVEIAQRGAIQVSLPYVVYQGGYPADNRAVGLNQSVDLASSALGDMRIDGRMLLAGTESDAFRLAFRGALFLPTGNEYAFTGERSGWGNVGLSAEYKAPTFFVTANAGWTIRPKSTFVDLTVGSEFTFAVGAYVPLMQDRLRVGAEVFGAVGFASQALEAIPIEGALAGRFALTPQRRVFLGLSAGGRIAPGYAPDVRMVVRIGGVFPFKEVQPEPPLPLHFAPEADTDHDGVLDTDDKCPTVAEDHKRENDGCPETDEDQDGLETSVDACPTIAEDKDGIDDDDGCPEDDADFDGFADIEDKCPKDPGVRNEDPARLGCPQYIERTLTEVLFKKKIGFETASATITTESYPILDEVARVLLANPHVKRVRIEGYTDDAGDPNFNRLLSRRRAEAVQTYLVQKGKVPITRLSFAGFGPVNPIAPNDTEEGRAKNRRVELHIVDTSGEKKETKP